jgi:hypothetical protein
MSQPEEKPKFDRSGKARTNETKYPYIVELSVPPTGLNIQLNRQITTFHKARHIQVRYGRIIVRNGENYYRWCFSDLLIARAFAEQFGGELCKSAL